MSVCKCLFVTCCETLNPVIWRFLIKEFIAKMAKSGGLFFGNFGGKKTFGLNSFFLVMRLIPQDKHFFLLSLKQPTGFKTAYCAFIWGVRRGGSVGVLLLILELPFFWIILISVLPSATPRDSVYVPYAQF